MPSLHLEITLGFISLGSLNNYCSHTVNDSVDRRVMYCQCFRFVLSDVAGHVSKLEKVINVIYSWILISTKHWSRTNSINQYSFY